MRQKENININSKTHVMTHIPVNTQPKPSGVRMDVKRAGCERYEMKGGVA